MNVANKYFFTVLSHGVRFTVEIEQIVDVRGYYRPDGFHTCDSEVWSLYCKSMFGRNFSSQASNLAEAMLVLTNNIKQHRGFDLMTKHFEAVGRYYERR